MSRRQRKLFGGHTVIRSWSRLGISARSTAFCGAAALLGLLVFAAGADALVHKRLETFSEATLTAQQPSFGNPSGLTFDQSNGDLLVIDLADHTLNRFGSEGQADNFPALGTSVIDGLSGAGGHSGAECEAAPEPESCDETPGNAGVLSVEIEGAAIEAQAAVAPPGAANGTAGYVYVTDAYHEQLDVFDASGKYLTQLSGVGYACGVAIDSEGDVYVGDWYGNIHTFVPTSTPGSYTNTSNFTSAQTGVEHPCILAAGAQPVASGGSEGFIFAINWSQAEEHVVKIDALTGAEQYPVDTAETNAGLAVNAASGRLYVAGGPAVKEYVVSGSTEAVLASSIALDGTARGVAVDGGTGNVYVTREGESHVEVWGPPEPTLPVVESGSEQVSAVGADGVTLEARASPEGAPLSYHVEYVDLHSFETEGGFASAHTVSTPERASGFEDSQFHALVESFTGLQPHTAYRWRIVATNSCAGNCGTTYGETAAFATPPPSGGALPDGRGYEMVSPTQKNNAQAGLPTGTQFSVVPQHASADGSAVTYASLTAFGEGIKGAGFPSQYLSRRGPAGWSTEPLDPEFQEGYTRDPLVGFSRDLGFAAVINIAPVLTANADQGLQNLYVRDNGTGVLTAVTTEPPSPRVWGPRAGYCVEFAGASSDFSHVYFGARNGALLPGDPEGAGSGYNLYEWSPAGGLKLVSTSADGTPVDPGSHNGFGNLSELGPCSMEGDLVRHAVSTDGSTAVWTYFPSGAPVLMDRLDGTHSVQLDAPNQDMPASEAGGGEYWDASTDGSKVFLTDNHHLAAGASATGSDLYRYDFARPEGERLVDLTASGSEPADVLGVVGASDAGDIVYFVAEGALTPPTDENQRGEHAEAGMGNLYVWREGEGNSFVAGLARGGFTIDPGDSNDWSANPKRQTARVTPDGQHLAFVSERSLTGYDNRIAGAPTCELSGGSYARSARCHEAFVYSLQSGTLVCASCDPSGARPTVAQPEVSYGGLELPLLGWPDPNEQPKQLSTDGSRLVFATFNPLVPGDVNRKRDVYQWEAAGTGTCSESAVGFSALDGGCMDLISTGRSGDESYLLDASANGNDIFFSTRQPLSWRDGDERFDVYDARVGGGEAPPPPAPCEGAGCRSAGTSGEGPQGLGSATLGGSGNVASCKALAAKAGRVGRRAKHLRSQARTVAGRNPTAAKRLRVKARRLSHRARGFRARAKRCERDNRRAAK